MKEQHFLEEKSFRPFIMTMLNSKCVVGPVAKKNKFLFAALANADELRLDYDVTMLPPKKEFFPTTQQLLTFKDATAQSSIDPHDKVIFGVHFYDVKAIDMLDQLFTQPIEDQNYTANRSKTTIIASNIQNVSPRAFFSSASKKLEPKGHDGFITKIEGGYLYEVLSKKGEALLAFGSFTKASPAQVTAAKHVNDAALAKCPKHLPADEGAISKKVRASFNNKALWEKLSQDCFSCGSCNIVCPTCYCFDVQDEWNIDQNSGQRFRKWDACMTREFSAVSLGGGHEENFRETAAERTRHRVMRKATYLNEKLGAAACVGCGRCSIACVPDIADPVDVITKIMEAGHE